MPHVLGVNVPQGLWRLDTGPGNHACSTAADFITRSTMGAKHVQSVWETIDPQYNHEMNSTPGCAAVWLTSCSVSNVLHWGEFPCSCHYWDHAEWSNVTRGVFSCQGRSCPVEWSLIWAINLYEAFKKNSLKWVCGVENCLCGRLWRGALEIMQVQPCSEMSHTILFWYEANLIWIWANSNRLSLEGAVCQRLWI